jgi:hypothetical protein
MQALTHEEIRSKVQSAPEHLVEDMLQVSTVNVLIGDSGLGKSPMLMQLGICVALGVPFLGLKTRKARVLYVDFENSIIDLNETLDNLSIFLGQPIPESFRVLHFPGSYAEFLKAIEEHKPELVIIDALRGFNPKAEKEPDVMAAMLGQLRKLAVEKTCTFEILHHLRKPDQKLPPRELADMSCSFIEWSLQAAGTRALINQTEARFGVENYTVGDASLIMRGHFKLKGEVGPWKIRRVFDNQENALGYERIVGLELLTQPDRERYLKLPESFTWSDAESILSMKAGKTLKRFISHCRASGLLYRTGSKKDGKYHKTPFGRGEGKGI